MEPMSTHLCCVVRSFQGGKVAFVANSTSMGSWVARGSYGGEVVGFCGTGNVAHAKTCAEAIGEVFRGREGAGYQGVGEFDGHEYCYQSAGKRCIGDR